MTARDVTVIDRIPYSAAVSSEQALSYCRRELVTRRGWVETAASVFRRFMSPVGRGPALEVRLPTIAHPGDHARAIAEACEEIAGAGFVSKPSDALRAMAEEAP